MESVCSSNTTEGSNPSLSAECSHKVCRVCRSPCRRNRHRGEQFALYHVSPVIWLRRNQGFTPPRSVGRCSRPSVRSSVASAPDATMARLDGRLVVRPSQVLARASVARSCTCHSATRWPVPQRHFVSRMHRPCRAEGHDRDARDSFSIEKSTPPAAGIWAAKASS